MSKPYHTSKDMRGPKSVKELKSEKSIVWSNIYKVSPEVNQVIYTMIPDCLQNFINLAPGVLIHFAYKIFLC